MAGVDGERKAQPTQGLMTYIGWNEILYFRKHYLRYYFLRVHQTLKYMPSLYQYSIKYNNLLLQ